MSEPYDPPRTQCKECDEFFNPNELDYGLCPSCLSSFQDSCLHIRRTALQGGNCCDCGVAFPDPIEQGREYEADERA